MTEDIFLYFNLDLTLTEMRKDFDEAVRETLRDSGVEESKIDAEKYSDLFFNYFNNLDDNPRKEAFSDYFSAKSLELDADKVVRIYEAKELGYVSPVEGLKDTLSELGENFRIGVITAGTSDLQRKKLEKLGIERVLDDILITYSEKEGKRKLFELAEEKYDADIFAYFSNSGSDIEKAREAGWETVHKDLEQIQENPVQKIREEVT